MQTAAFSQMMHTSASSTSFLCVAADAVTDDLTIPANDVLYLPTNSTSVPSILSGLNSSSSSYQPAFNCTVSSEHCFASFNASFARLVQTSFCCIHALLSSVCHKLSCAFCHICCVFSLGQVLLFKCHVEKELHITKVLHVAASSQRLVHLVSTAYMMPFAHMVLMMSLQSLRCYCCSVVKELLAVCLVSNT